jgi:membrane associated rhomboid family serine protease
VLLFIIILVRVIPVPAWLMLGIWFALQIVNGTMTPTDGGGVAYWAHAGGFIAGLVMVVPMWLARGGTDFWQRTQGLPPHPAARYEVTRSRIPTVRRLR